MKYTLRPAREHNSPIRGLPFHPSPDYLRENLATVLEAEAVAFDFCVQLQTDPVLMPIEDSSTRWPESLSPYRRVASLRIPSQRLDESEQRRLARALAFDPWHCLQEHLPLGNLNRARHRIYGELSRHRQFRNGVRRWEPVSHEAPPT
jgi:hypothetical protein